MPQNRFFYAMFLLVAIALPAASEDTFLEQWAATYRFRLGRPTAVTPAPDGLKILFLRSGPRSFVQDLWQLDLATGRESVLLTASTLLAGRAEVLSADEQARRERMRQAARGIASFSISSDGRRLLIPLGPDLFVVRRGDGAVSRLPADGGFPLDPQFSPDGTRVACVREGDLYVTDLRSGEQRRVTAGATADRTNGVAEFVAQEEMSRFHGYWWSPDSKRILYQLTDTTEMEHLTIADAVRPERTPERWPYPRPGKRNATIQLGLIDVGGWATTRVQWNPGSYEYLAVVRWPERGPLTLQVQNRRQTELALLKVDLESGSTTPLLVERDAAWVDIDQEMPRWLPDGSGFLWITERDGSRRLELRNADGTLRHALTEPGFGLREFEHAWFENGTLLVRAATDPTQSHLWRVPLDPAAGPPVQLTATPGIHRIVSRGDSLAVAESATADGHAWEAFDADGPTGQRIASVAETPDLQPNLEFTTVGSDPPLHAVIVRPRAVSPNRRYPVINHVYGGPTSQMVQRDPSRYLLDQWIADQGYIVVSVDGRGTPGRGRDWNRAVKFDLIAAPLEDQAAAMRMLGQRYPEIDHTRVGIYGWSFGGYFSAMAVMRRPDVFHAAVAGAPVVSWLDYDTHYTERYMDLPENNAEGYRSTDVLTWTEKLQRPLLVIHGTGDDNVYFMHSLKLADALFRAGRRFEFLPLPGFTHMVPDPLVTRRLYGRIIALFDRALKGEEPRDEREKSAPPYR